MSTFKPEWQALKNLSEEEIEARAKADPDAQPTTKAEWNNARVIMPSGETKQVITMRVSSKVLDFFKQEGKGYQSRMHAVLEAYVDQEARQQA